MKKLLTLIVATTYLLLNIAHGLEKPSNTTSGIDPSAVAQTTAPSFLLVVQSKTGDIKKMSTGVYELILQKSDIHHLLMFSDRPYRIVSHITGKAIAKLWTTGTNSFKVDPPNAVLTADGKKAVIVILNSYRIEDSQVIMRMRFSGHTSIVWHALSNGRVDRIPLRNITVTIDGFCSNTKSNNC